MQQSTQRDLSTTQNWVLADPGVPTLRCMSIMGFNGIPSGIATWVRNRCKERIPWRVGQHIEPCRLSKNDPCGC